MRKQHKCSVIPSKKAAFGRLFCVGNGLPRQSEDWLAMTRYCKSSILQQTQLVENQAFQQAEAAHGAAIRFTRFPAQWSTAAGFPSLFRQSGRRLPNGSRRFFGFRAVKAPGVRNPARGGALGTNLQKRTAEIVHLTKKQELR